MPGLVERALPAFFGAAAGEFELAVERAGLVLVQRWFGGCGVRLRFAGGGLAEVLLGGLAGVDVGGGGVRATIDLWEEVVCPSGPVAVPWAMGDIGPGGFVRGEGGGRVVAVHDTFAGAVTVVDREARAVLHRVRDYGAVPWWERAAPLRAALYWALSGPGRHLVHAGAVGDERGGVLLAGASGSGKTTVALAALAAGLGYVADDYVLLDVTGRPNASALYSTAKLDDGHLMRFPSFAAAVRFPPASAAGEKAVLDADVAHPGSLRPSLPVRGVVVPKIRGGRTRVHEVGPADALRALAPSTMLQLPFHDREALGSLAGLVRSVPCFALDVGDDVGELGGAVRRVLGLVVS